MEDCRRKRRRRRRRRERTGSKWFRPGPKKCKQSTTHIRLVTCALVILAKNHPFQMYEFWVWNQLNQKLIHLKWMRSLSLVPTIVYYTSGWSCLCMYLYGPQYVYSRLHSSAGPIAYGEQQSGWILISFRFLALNTWMCNYFTWYYYCLIDCFGLVWVKANDIIASHCQ